MTEPVSDPRFAFLSPHWDAAAREALATLRHGSRSPNGRPCLRCDAERAHEWHPSPFRWGDRRSHRAWWCGDCAQRPLGPVEQAQLIAKAMRGGRR